MALVPGQVLNNRYRIVKLLGQGGFGAVYRAWDLSKGESCAVKENLDTSTAAQNQFEREARLLFGLSHPNLPRVFDHFLIPGQGQYLVMDFVAGNNLEQLAAQSGQITEMQALTWIGQVCDALSYLHSLNPAVIHRDIKPANIVITPQGQAMLVDFGIAKAYNPQLKTSTGARAVTPGYSPLEQYGTGITDARSDIYALAATCYTLLTGEVPPEAPGRSLNDTLTPARAINPNTSPHVSVALSQALQVRMELRYPDANAFKAALGGYGPLIVQQPVGQLPVTATIKTTPGGGTPRRRVLIGLAIGGILLSLVMVCGLAAFFGDDLVRFLQDGGRPATGSGEVYTRTPAETELAVATPEWTRAAEEVLTPLIPSLVLPTLTFTRGADTALATLTFTPFPDTPTPFATTPVPMPGGLIAFNSKRNGNNDIYVMNADGSGVRQLTFSPASETVPAWSPDGRFLSYQSDEAAGIQIYVIDLQTERIQQITNMTCSNWAPSWSPDEQSFVFYSDCDGSYEIYTMDVSGGNRRQLTFTENTYNKFPIWSPDGRKIIFASNRTGKYKVFVMNRDGSNPQALANGCVCAYSPDGEWIVFSQYCDDLGTISKMRADGSDSQTLDEQYGNTNPSWSNDGRWIVFQSDRGGNEDIWIMDADGGNWQQLTSDPARDSAAVWQPVVR